MTALNEQPEINGWVFRRFYLMSPSTSLWSLHSWLALQVANWRTASGPTRNSKGCDWHSRQTETLKEEGLNRVSSVLASPFSQGRSRGGRSRPTGVFAPATKGLSYLLVSLMSLSAFLRALKELDLPAPPTFRVAVEDSDFWPCLFSRLSQGSSEVYPDLALLQGDKLGYHIHGTELSGRASPAMM